MKLFDCEQRWVDHQFDALFFGHAKLRVVGLPMSGKTLLISEIVAKLRDEVASLEDVICFDGREFTELNQSELMNSIVDRIESAVARSGEAYLIFDHYGHALRRTKAGRLQSLLFSAIVNSTASANIGCLLAHRYRQRYNLDIPASPFVNRLKYVELPSLNKIDLSNPEVSRAAAVAGRNPAMVRSAMVAENTRFSQISWETSWSASSSQISRDIPAGEISNLQSVEEIDRNSSSMSDVLWALTDPATDRLPAGISQGLVERLQWSQGAWPTIGPQSAERFASLLDELGASYWYDRYLLSPDTQQATMLFLHNLRLLSDVPLRILASKLPDWSSDAVDRLVVEVNAVPHCEVRIVKADAARKLHDRHLTSVADGTGYALPQAREIVTALRTGNSAESRLSARPVDYGVQWRSAKVTGSE